MARTAKAFTLLELLVVLAILTILAGAMIVTVEGTGDQIRFNTAKQQHQNIRQAILGSQAVSPQGVVTVSGYIADVGATPTNLSALVIRPATCLKWGTLGSEIAISEWNGAQQPSGIILKRGWRGPYLQIDFSESDHDQDSSTPPIADKLLDPWGNNWESSYNPNHPDGITFYSLGKDNSIGIDPLVNQEDDPYSYNQDYPSGSKQTLGKELFQIDLESTPLPSLAITNNLTHQLHIGLLHPNLDLSETFNDIIEGHHPSLIRNPSNDLITILASSTTTLGSTPQTSGSFGGFPFAYRYQLAVYKNSNDTSKSLANQLIAVFPIEFIFSPRCSSSAPMPTNPNWEISP